MKTRDLQWYDLFERRGTRRDFLRLGGGVAGVIALGSLPSCGTARGVRFRDDPFPLGVASGDPAPDGVVLWTRLGPTALDASGTVTGAVDVAWEIAEDEAFARVVRSGSAAALPELGHSVHVEVDGLAGGRDYFYRMIAGGEPSPVGRTRTAPPAGDPIDRLRFAFISCQHYETGWYTALRHLAAEDVGFVAHLGDYIYEGGRDRRVRVHEGPEVTTLEGYRARYTTYRSDVDLQAAHAAAPWIVTWDDHEVDNDYAGTAAEDDQNPDQLLLRRAAAYQAYYEFMPLRRSSMPNGPDMPLYRRLAFGDLVEMSVLDTRQYRSKQPCGGENEVTCAAHVSPGQTILGDAQRRWLADGLAASGARWNVLAQQVMMARLRGVRDDGSETWSMDKWDGYPGERRALLDLLAERRVSNPVVLTGDIHSHWVTDLLADFEDERSAVVATEFVGTSISSGGDGQAMTAGGERIVGVNPHIRFYNGQRGYVVATVTPDLWTSDYRIVPYVSEPGAPLETAASFVVESGTAGAQRA